ncbi:MAG TPA: hypothetical protein VFS05_07825, partial [Gemmatimonadaceae bacterium]|nr:hypothetical protein [Gemmatimonadaceae bacterium]
ATASTAVALLPLNYGLYALLGTPTFVLLAELGSHDWSLVWARVVDTLVGAVLAYVATRLLWPSSERERFAEYVAGAIRAGERYLREVLAAVAGDHPETAAPAAARRRLGLAIINAETSLQRLANEGRSASAGQEALMAATAYLRRFGSSLTALSLAQPVSGAGASREALRRFGEGATRVLADLAAAVEARRAPASLPADIGAALPALAAEPAVRSLVERVARQLTVLHAVLSRVAAPATLSPTPITEAR